MNGTYCSALIYYCALICYCALIYYYAPVSYTHLLDTKIIPKDTNSNLMVDNVRITQLASPVNNKDAVNLEFLNQHTITAVNDSYLNAQGKAILNVGDGGARPTDAVNARQLEDVKRYAKAETYKFAKVFQRRWEKVVSYIYKLHTHAARTSLGAEEADLLLCLLYTSRCV